MFGLGFISFVAAILNFVGLFSLWQIDWNFVHGFSGSRFELEFWISDFKIRILDFEFQKSEVPTELLHFYIDIYLFVKWKHIERAQ